ncbi:SpoIIE family protein phosphatase [Embleya sp. NPDC059237]|uniref:SpoIIE family protein phosphatase n=1 Tax=Embleya sp. NPDC059237 TaxID=3346784 RepID=UPI00369F0036
MLSTCELQDIRHGRAAVFDVAKVTTVFQEPRRLPESLHSAMWAPLFAHGLVLGTVIVWRTDQPDPFDADVDLLAEIASRAALGIRQRPPLHPRAPIDTRAPAAPAPGARDRHARSRDHGPVLPTSSAAGIGADWYDVIPRPSFRVALVIGDVAGHGLYATMGRLRTAVRMLADLELDPTELFTHLDADAVAVAPGPPLGVDGLPFETAVVDIGPGSVLTLYADGLIERRDTDPDDGPRRLVEGLSASCDPDRPLEDTGRELVTDPTSTVSRRAMTSRCSRPACGPYRRSTPRVGSSRRTRPPWPALAVSSDNSPPGALRAWLSPRN